MYNDLQNDYLIHHGILGQKWGVRRFQNKDGSLTKAGERRYGDYDGSDNSNNANNPSVRKLSKKELKQLYKKEPEIRKIYDKRNIEKLSDDELRARTNRIKLENDYVQLVPKTKEELRKEHNDKIKREINKALWESSITAGKKVLEYGIEKAGKELVKQVMKEEFNIDNKDDKKQNNNDKKDDKKKDDKKDDFFSKILSHSAKGTTWSKDDAKYYKKVKVPSGKINYYYKKAISTYKDEVTKDNMFVTDAENYDEQMQKIMNSKEWQDIVKSNNPEYVRTLADGTKKYLVDDYLVKKKHPLLDVIDDAAYGRELNVNKVTKDSVKAGVHDYVQMGTTVLQTASKLLIGRFKFTQGSYENNETAKKGKSLINDVINIYSKYN